MPTKNETSSLFFWTGSGAFAHVRDYIYWSSSSYDAPRAWYIHLNLGDEGIVDKSNEYYVWPVRNSKR